MEKTLENRIGILEKKVKRLEEIYNWFKAKEEVDLMTDDKILERGRKIAENYEKNKVMIQIIDNKGKVVKEYEKKGVNNVIPK